ARAAPSRSVEGSRRAAGRHRHRDRQGARRRSLPGGRAAWPPDLRGHELLRRASPAPDPQADPGRMARLRRCAVSSRDRRAVQRAHVVGMRRIRAAVVSLGASLVVALSAGAADAAGADTAGDLFTAIVGTILGGPTSAVHGTDGRRDVLSELAFTTPPHAPPPLPALASL